MGIAPTNKTKTKKIKTKRKGSGMRFLPYSVNGHYIVQSIFKTLSPLHWDDVQQ